MSQALRSAGFVLQRFVLGRRVLTARIPEFGLTLRVPARDVVGRHLYKYRIHEPGISRYLARHLALQPGDLVLDVGANIGWYSLLLAHIAPEDVAIHAFEPDPWVRGLLEENLRMNGATSVTAVGAAVGEAPGRARLYLYGDANRGRNSMLPINQGEAIEVEVVSLDDYLARQGQSPRPIGFLKVDVEGYESFVLKGGTQALQRCRVVMTEYSPRYMRQAGLEPAVLLDLLATAGFAPSVLGGEALEPVGRADLLASDRHRDLLWQRAEPAPAS